jgi:hypothetical protein
MDSTTAMDPEYEDDSHSDDSYDEDAPPVPTKVEARQRRRAELEARRAERLEHLGFNQALRQQANKDKVVKRARGECYVEPTAQLIDKQKGTLPVIKIKQAPLIVTKITLAPPREKPRDTSKILWVSLLRNTPKIKPARPREEPRRIRTKQRLVPMELYQMEEEESDDGDGASVPPRYDAVKLRLARGLKEPTREWVLREYGAPR